MVANGIQSSGGGGYECVVPHAKAVVGRAPLLAEALENVERALLHDQPWKACRIPVQTARGECREGADREDTHLIARLFRMEERHERGDGLHERSHVERRVEDISELL